MARQALSRWSIQPRCLLAAAHLGSCVVQAQQSPRDCVSKVRTDREIIVCAEAVDDRLRSLQIGIVGFGKRVAGYIGQHRFYPPGRQGLNPKRYKTTDKNFKAQSDSLLNGRWTITTRNGQLLLDELYEGGYLRSSRTYDPKGRLREWFDYSIATQYEPYRCFVQKCTWFLGKETVTEYIIFNLEGVIAPYLVDYLRPGDMATPGPED
jgi:hypothetical protein